MLMLAEWENQYSIFWKQKNLKGLFGDKDLQGLFKKKKSFLKALKGPYEPWVW